MQHLQQPEKSSLCGQTCLAMLTGQSIEDMTSLFGTKGTSTKDLANALTKLGFTHSKKLIPRRTKPLPTHAIAKVRREWNKSGNWHWVLVVNGYIYDPAAKTTDTAIMTIDAFDAHMAKTNQKLSSYLAIYK